MQQLQNSALNLTQIQYQNGQVKLVNQEIIGLIRR